MFQKMLEMLETRTAEAMERRKSASALWLHAWASETRKAFEPGRKVVYASAYAFPMEILRAFDVSLFDFELASGLMAASETIVPPLEAAEGEGLSRDVCCFHRAAVGAFHGGMFPRPDLLLTISFYCDGKVKTNEILSRMSGVDSALLYVPHEINRDSIAYVEAQLREIIEKLERVTGQRLDEERLREVVRLSNRIRRSRLRLLELLKHRPAPWGGQRMLAYSISGQFLAASPVKERINQAFIEEMEARIAAHRMEEERHRLYWFAWPPAYPSILFDTFREHGVSVPLCETIQVYWDEIDEDRPLEGLALKCLQNPFLGNGRRRTEGLGAIREAYGVDGAALFATPACRHSKTAYRLLQDAAARQGMPFLLLDMDIGDTRTYSPEQIRTRVEGFSELLDQRG